MKNIGKIISIIGVGNGGQAFVGYFAIQGHIVRIFDVSQKTVNCLNEKGGVQIVGNSDVTGEPPKKSLFLSKTKGQGLVCWREIWYNIKDVVVYAKTST